MDNTQELKPCPFCGRVPVLKEVRFPAKALAPSSPKPEGYWWIGCEIDVNITGCGIGHSHMDKPGAIQKWNTRARDEVFDELVEALGLLVADVQDYPTWQRPCHALDNATAALERARSLSVPARDAGN